MVLLERAWLGVLLNLGFDLAVGWGWGGLGQANGLFSGGAGGWSGESLVIMGGGAWAESVGRVSAGWV